ncbi:hypothetical protein [Pseudomonas phage PA1C]|uniref:Uncharacterized protein n=2 Tax=root TaxID=1 RepID=A0A5C1K7Z0_9CAUD|nr:hypothetical protein PP933_gp347 [Pseudomonas phage vB_PaeM_PS119XW]QBX32504.1 hypothetical protein [Pseudomonas phage PA1C]QEM42076.1 hypothetical protein [Pseudomonas phage vB_PaeM_PS119XW]BEG72590.1 hypothetical protein RVBP21_2180 [Pseudomonas phage BRkr]
MAKATTNPIIQEKLNELRYDSDWLYYMSIQFPSWMSMTPGASNYKNSMTPDEYYAHIQAWRSMTDDLIRVREVLGISMSGMTSETLVHLDVNEVMREFSLSATLRNHRNQWKANMLYLGLDCGDHLWRPKERELVVGQTEWARFREAIINGVY